MGYLGEAPTLVLCGPPRSEKEATGPMKGVSCALAKPRLWATTDSGPLALLVHIPPTAPAARLPTSPARARRWLPWHRAPVWGRVAHSAKDWGIVAWVLGVVLDPGSPRSWLQDREPPLWS